MKKFYLRFVSVRGTTAQKTDVGPFETTQGAQGKFREMLNEGQPLASDPLVGKQVVDESGKMLINMG